MSKGMRRKIVGEGIFANLAGMNRTFFQTLRTNPVDSSIVPCWFVKNQNGILPPGNPPMPPFPPPPPICFIIWLILPLFFIILRI